MKDDYSTNSCYLTHTFSLSNVGRMYLLSLGVKGSINGSKAPPARLSITKSWPPSVDEGERVRFRGKINSYYGSLMASFLF